MMAFWDSAVRSAFSICKGVCRRSSTAASALRQGLSRQLEDIRAAGTWKVERVIKSPQAAAIRVQGTSGDLLNFCANNYLGLSVSTCMYLL